MVCICCCPDEAHDAARVGPHAVSVRQNAQDLPRPEWKITWFVFLEMFLASATSSVATIGVVWATVVLLGGFVSNLNILDFWLIIALTLIQSMRFDDTDEEPLRLYYIHVSKLCRDGCISNALDMNLASFAVQCLKSNERDVSSSGIRLLYNQTMAAEAAFRAEAITKLRASNDAVESLFRLMASTSPEETRERKMAAWLIAMLPDSFHISGFLFAMQSICSLLEATNGDSGIDEVLVRKGLEILEKLSRHVCNMSHISDSHELTVKITEFSSHIEIAQASDENHIDFVKVKCSLAVLGNLAGATGKRGSILRQDIIANVLLLSNIREMLQNSSISYVLRELAIRVVDGFALDPESRNCGATRKMVIVLLAIFCSPHDVNDDVQIQFQLAAGITVARLTTESASNCNAIIMAGEENLEALRSMILGQPITAHGVAAANVLRNLCAYLTPGSPCQNTMKKFAEANILTVLTTICQTDNLVAETMEAFLSLALQLSRVLETNRQEGQLSRVLNEANANPSADFRVALDEIGSENFVRKLKSVLDEANARHGAADWRPGIRRAAIELAIWMIQSEDQLHCNQHFVECEMRDSLVAVQVKKEEDYKLLSAGDAPAPVLEHDESLSALVKTALRLIPEGQNVQLPPA